MYAARNPYEISSQSPSSYLVPMVIEKSQYGERAYDIYSRLLKDRIIILGTPVTDEISNIIVAQMLFLESQDKSRDIKLYVNSPGGSVSAGLAIYDAMQHVSCDVSTICMGLAASMGAVILAGGAKGKRYALPNSEIMIHQPLGGVEGQATDIKIRAERILKTKEQLNKILSKHTGQALKKVEEDTDRDYFMDPKDAAKYGIIDRVIE